MIQNKKDFLTGFLLSAFLFGALLTVVLVPKNLHQNPSAKDNVFIVWENPSGKVVLGQHNLITNIGENWTAAFHWTNTTSANAVEYISIGNATAAVGLTVLTSEYGRYNGAVANWTNSGDYAYNVTYTHMFTETKNINCAGSHWASSGDGNLYAVANFVGGAVTFNANDNLTITWVKTFDCN